MKVILISGSPRLQGNTMATMEACAREIEAHGVEAEVISLAGKDIRACRACAQCVACTGCVVKDDSQPIFEKIAQADGLIIGAPVYYGTARGDVMNFIQRLGRYSGSHGRFLDGMVGGPVAVARRGGQTATIQEMLMFCFICGMIVPGSNYWNMIVARDPGDAERDEEGIRTATIFAGRVADLVKKLRG